MFSITKTSGGGSAAWAEPLNPPRYVSYLRRRVEGNLHDFSPEAFKESCNDALHGSVKNPPLTRAAKRRIAGNLRKTLLFEPKLCFPYAG